MKRDLTEARLVGWPEDNGKSTDCQCLPLGKCIDISINFKEGGREGGGSGLPRPLPLDLPLQQFVAIVFSASPPLRCPTIRG